MAYRKELLREARRYRTCPPPHIMEDPRHFESLARHRRICPYCAAGTDQENPWHTLFDNIIRMAGPRDEMAEAGDIQPGEFRCIRPDRGTWRDGNYYSPPMVLVLEKTGTISDDLRVAQVYHDTGLAGPGDLVLTGEQTGREELFVETWNIYTLKAGYLGPPVGRRQDADIIQSVQKMADDPEYLPEWAMLTRPLADEDARIYFRRLEIEVGYSFASQAVEALMDELEGSEPVLVYDSDEEIREAVRAVMPSVSWNLTPETPGEILAFAQLPPEETAMAASDGTEETVPGNLFLLKEGRIASCRTVRVRILGWSPIATGVEMIGQIMELPADLNQSSLYCYLHDPETGVQSPQDDDWDEKEGRFRVVFHCPAETEGRLSFAVVGEAE